MTMESLLKDKELTSIIKDLVHGSGRSYPGKLQHVDSDQGESVPLAAHGNGVSQKEIAAV